MVASPASLTAVITVKRQCWATQCLCTVWGPEIVCGFFLFSHFFTLMQTAVLNLCGLLSRQAINSTLQLDKSRKPQEHRALVVWRFNAQCTRRFEPFTYSWMLCMVLISYMTKIPLNLKLLSTFCLGKTQTAQFSSVCDLLTWNAAGKGMRWLLSAWSIPCQYLRSLIRRSVMDWSRASIPRWFQSARTVLSLRHWITKILWDNCEAFYCPINALLSVGPIITCALEPVRSEQSSI